MRSEIVHDGLDAADVVTLGTVRIWGVIPDISNVTLSEQGGSSVEHHLTFQHNPDTKVRKHIYVCLCVLRKRAKERI